MKPLADRVLVEAAAAEETTKGGIIIPDTAKEKPQRGKVIAIGTGRVADDGKVTPLSVKVGDSILSVSYTHLRAHETVLDLVCRLLLEKKTHYTLYK